MKRREKTIAGERLPNAFQMGMWVEEQSLSGAGKVRVHMCTREENDEKWTKEPHRVCEGWVLRGTRYHRKQE